MRQAARFGALPQGKKWQPGVDYEFDVVLHTASPGVAYIPPGRAIGQTTYVGQNLLTGSTTGAGAGFVGTDAALQVRDGAFSAGIHFDSRAFAGGNFSPIPFVGMGEVHYSFDNGVGVGYWSVGGSGLSLAPPQILVPVMFLQSLIKLSQTEITEAADVPRVVASTVIPKLIPVNTATELFHFLKFATTEPAGTEPIETPDQFREAMSLLTSYNRQGLLYEALNELNAHLMGTTDPYLRAQLMDQRDLFLFNLNRNFLRITIQDGSVTTATVLMEKYQREAVERVETFQRKYGEWMVSNRGEAPPQDEIREFMADSLYLAQKLQFAFEEKKKGKKLVYEITHSPAFAIDDPALAVRYLEALTKTYGALAGEDSGLSQWVSSTLSGSIHHLMSATNDATASEDRLLSLKMTTDGLAEWVNQMRRMVPHFENRKAHLLWLIHEEADDGDREALSRRAEAASIAAPQVVQTLSGPILKDPYAHLVDGAVVRDAYDLYQTVKKAFDALELVVAQSRQPYTDGIDLVDWWRRGFDFVGAGKDRISMTDAFSAYYEQYRIDAQHWDAKPEIRRLFASLHDRSRRMLAETGKARPGQVYWDIRGLRGEIEEGKKKVDESKEDVIEAVEDLEGLISDLEKDPEIAPLVAPLRSDWPNFKRLRDAASHWRGATLSGYRSMKTLRPVESAERLWLVQHIDPALDHLSRLVIPHFRQVRREVLLSDGMKDEEREKKLERLDALLAHLGNLQASLAGFRQAYENLNRVRTGGTTLLALHGRWGIRPRLPNFDPFP